MGKPRGGKAAVKDFEKKKQKLGKKKLAPTNSTSTQFKARSVVLPDQTIGAERGEPVSHRQLTLGELVGQLKHYSADVRHDAVRGLLELVTRHPEVLAPRAVDNLGFTKGWANHVKAPETRGEAPDFFGEPPSDED